MRYAFEIPAVVRAMPPRCQEIKQVFFWYKLWRELPVVEHLAAPIVAEIQNRDGSQLPIRHDGASFIRPADRLVGTAAELETIVRPLQPYSHSLTSGSENWPPYDSAKKRRKWEVDRNDVQDFAELVRRDLDRCDQVVEKVMSRVVECEGEPWIRCGEPCYRVGNFRRVSGQTVLGLDASFVEFVPTDRLDVIAVSATAENAAISFWSRASQHHAVRGNERIVDRIEVLDPSPFEHDYARDALTRSMRAVSGAIAKTMSESDDREIPNLERVGFDEIDTWNTLRRRLDRLIAGEPEEDADEQAFDNAWSLWKRLGQRDNRRALGCMGVSGETADFWHGLQQEVFEGRPLNIPVMSPFDGASRK